MAAPDVVSSQSPVERTDEQLRDTTSASGGTCGFTWCEVENLQDTFCGNGISQMDSRDDDAPAEGQVLPLSGSSSFIDGTLKMFTHEVGRTKSLPNKDNTSGLTGEANPATLSKMDSVKVNRSVSVGANSLSNPHALGNTGRGVEKSKYESFMSRVDAASKTYGAQSIPVADLYVTMGIGCTKSYNSDAKSKELALLLFEEAFTIYQAKSGDSHEQTVMCRILLGRTHLSLGNYDKALDCFCMAAYMREALLGELHPNVSEVWVLIASVHQAKSKFELALKASAKALTGYRNAHGDKHPLVIDVLKTIAQIHIQMGNNDKAADIQKYVRLHTPKGADTKAEF